MGWKFDLRSRSETDIHDGMHRVFGILGFLLFAFPAAADSLVDQLLASYDAIETVTCEVRKDTTSDGSRIRMLSRVYFQRPDRIHVENVTPVPRRIVSDGVVFHSHVEGASRGYRCFVSELDESFLHTLRRVPGTAMDHLFRLRGAEETELDGTEEFPVRRGYRVDLHRVVLSLDDTGRLARIEFFEPDAAGESRARFDYSGFVEVLDGVWIPTLHQGRSSLGGVELRETSRISNLSVNTPIAGELFVPGPFFKGVEFVGRIEDL